MLHDEVAEALGKQPVRGGRVVPDTHEDLVSGREMSDLRRCGSAFSEDSYSVGELGFVEIGDIDIYGVVIVDVSQILQRGGAEVLDDGVGAVEPGFADAEELFAGGE